MTEEPAHLRLDRRRAHLQFASWRLSSSILRSQGSVALPAPAVAAQATDTDYVVARHVALLNGLSQQPRGCYCFLEEGGQGQEDHEAQAVLYQVDLGEGSKPPQLQRVSGVPQMQQELPAGGLTSGSLPPSVVEVQTAVAAGSDEDAASPFGSLLLLSSGQGDLSLVARPAAGAGAQGTASLSTPVFPLRPPPPLQGARPVHLLAAFLLPCSQAAGSDVAGTATICCILWTPRPRSDGQPSRCEVHAVRLAAQLALPLRLHVEAVQLLRVSDLPPHGVLVSPAACSVLLALQPSSASLEEEATAQRAAAAASAASGARQQELEGGGEDAEAVSPRTLQAAAARLAAYTSEEPVGALSHQQYADLYRETGPDGVGAMGAEPSCSLYTFGLAEAAGEAGSAGSEAASQAPNPAGAAAAGLEAAATAGAAAAAAAAAGAGDEGGPAPASSGPVLRLIHTLSCQPHKLLTCHLELPAGGAQEPPTPDTHLPQGGGCGGGSGGDSPSQQQQQQRQQADSVSSGPRLLLGLTDDVDCAVVAVACGSGGFEVSHVTSVPAMAYVAAGKMQRKFLLLAPPGGDVACALVETQQYAYLYRGVSPPQQYGEHQVLDMELTGGRHGLLGAVLAGNRTGACRLLLLAREGLSVVDL